MPTAPTPWPAMCLTFVGSGVREGSFTTGLVLFVAMQVEFFAHANLGECPST